jgi:hypothetical protein
MLNEQRGFQAAQGKVIAELVKLNLCLELTGFTFDLSSQLGLLKHTQLPLNKQLLPAIQVGRYAAL